MKRFLIMLPVVTFMVMIIVAPANASSQKIVFEDGSYCISVSKASTIQPIAVDTVARMASTSGWGGTATPSGARSVWVTTKFYSWFGKLICSVRSGVRWTWSGGVITSHTRYKPKLIVSSHVPLTSINMTYRWGEQWWFSWNGKPHGGWYTSVDMHVSQSIFKYGVLGASDVSHEYKEYANGRYWWEATL